MRFTSIGGKMQKKLYLFIIAVIIGISGVFYLIRWNDSQKIQTEFIKTTQEETKQEVAQQEIPSQDNALNETAAENNSEQEIFVYVCGYVNSPGVYSLKPDARLYEAVDMAGGITSEGCADFLELAQTMYDGQRIYVPSKEEAVNTASEYNAAETSQTQSGKININNATKAQLMTLSGIGEAKAEAIIKYRETNGAFGSIEDIMNISGIKQSAFDKIKDYICV
jgi:competence protein ComEA